MTSTSNNLDNHAAEISALSLKKAALECQKLEAEIVQVKLKWWKRPGYIGGLVPIVLAIVGFLSATSVGYFDSRRQLLELSVQTLQFEKDDLVENTVALQEEQKTLTATNRALKLKITQNQDKIDQSYIELKFAGHDLGYAASHLSLCTNEISDKDMSLLPNTRGAFSRESSKTVDQLKACYETVRIILPIIQTSNDFYQNKLSQLPASKWATDLTPEIGPLSILRSPDGRIYHPATSKFYANEKELKNALNK